MPSDNAVRRAKRRTAKAIDAGDIGMDSANGDDGQINLGYTPRPWQIKVHTKKKRFTVLVCHRRAGKSVCAILELIDSALALDPSLRAGRYAYIAPQKNQAKDIAWDYLKEYALKVPNTIVNETESYVQFQLANANGKIVERRIKIYGAGDIEALRGRYFDGIVVDEVADIKVGAWGEILRPCLVDRKGWAMFLGTPKGINLLSQLYYKAIGVGEIDGDKTDKSDWLGMVFTVEETGAIPEAELADLRSDLTDSQYRQEFLCDFNAGSDDSLLSMDDIERAVNRGIENVEYSRNCLLPVVVGVDVARKGSDSSCICVRQGARILFLKRYKEFDEMSLVMEVLRVSKEYGADAVFVDGTGGYGGGVVEALKRFNCNAIDVQFASRTQLRDKKFLNKRAEMYWDAAQWIKTVGILPDDHQLKKEFAAQKYFHNGAGLLQLLKKEEIKATGIGSPDSADAVVLTFAFDVAASYSPAVTPYSAMLAKGYSICSSIDDELNSCRKYGSSMRL